MGRRFTSCLGYVIVLITLLLLAVLIHQKYDAKPESLKPTDPAPSTVPLAPVN